jgi:3-hydroxybutyrate dehydrogenase
MRIEVMGRADKVARTLEGKVALVTGSTSGIGLGVARALAKAGAQIVAQRLREAGGHRRRARDDRE